MLKLKIKNNTNVNENNTNVNENNTNVNENNTPVIENNTPVIENNTPSLEQNDQKKKIKLNNFEQNYTQLFKTININDEGILQIFQNIKNLKSDNNNIIANMIYYNIKDNPVIIEKINNKEIDDITNIKLSELNIKKWKEINELEEKKKKILTLQVESTIYICGKCKKNRTTYYQKQTRSCDEGMTFFITCLNCKNFWKQ